MKILQLVTLLSKGGEFGGPMNVALDQCRALTALGHEVELYTGWDGEAALPADLPFPVHKYRVRQAVPRTGFSGLVSVHLLTDLARYVGRYDVLHVHLARDLITAPAARVVLSRVPIIVQPHGQIISDSRRKTRLFDALAVRRVMSGAANVLCLTPLELTRIAETLLADPSRLAIMGNGVHAARVLLPREVRRKDRVPVVLFCARLHPRKGLGRFLEMALRLSATGFDARYVVIGPDEGDLWRVRAFNRSTNSECTVSYLGAMGRDQVQEHMSQADVLVVASENEPFGMTILESLAVGTPVVLSDECAIGSRLAELGAADLTDNSPEQLAASVERLCTNPVLWAERSAAGLRATAHEYSMSHVARRLEAIYAECVRQ